MFQAKAILTTMLGGYNIMSISVSASRESLKVVQRFIIYLQSTDNHDLRLKPSVPDKKLAITVYSLRSHI
jgi:hypothetical protein